MSKKAGKESQYSLMAPSSAKVGVGGVTYMVKSICIYVYVLLDAFVHVFVTIVIMVVHIYGSSLSYKA